MRPAATITHVTEGLFALLGALVGAVGALIAARSQANKQDRTGHEQWLRQIRREVYSDFLVKAQRIDGPLGYLVVTTGDARMPHEEREELRAQIRTAAADLNQAAENMALEASEDLARLVKQFHASIHMLLRRERVATNVGSGMEGLREYWDDSRALLEQITEKCRAAIQER